MSAVKCRNFKAVRSLLKAGANKDLTPKFGDYADQPIRPIPLIDDLLHDSDPSTYCDLGFFNAAEDGHDFKFPDENPNALNSRGETALFVASKCNEYHWLFSVWRTASRQCHIKAGKNYILIFEFYI